ncbi:myotrophin [Penaeus vannamei]
MAASNQNNCPLALVRAGDAEGLRAALAALSDKACARFWRSSQPLHVAAGKGHREIVEALLAGGADPNAQDRKGIGPLVMAAKEGHREVVEMLLAGGADPNARVGFGFFSKDSRALHVAAKKGHKEVVEALLAGDADPNA